MNYSKASKCIVFELFALFLMYTSAFSIQKDAKISVAVNERQPYLQGELIVKLKGEKAEDAAFEIQNGKDLSADNIQGLESFNNLNRKYMAKNIEPLFKSLRKNGNILKADFNLPKLENIYKIQLAGNIDIQQAIKEYSKDPNVEYAEPDYKVEVQMVPDDPYYSSNGTWGQGYEDLWGLRKINAEKAWDISQGEGVVVAVVDTGIDYTHEDIAANIWTNPGEIAGDGIDNDDNGFVDDVRGWDFAYGDNDPKDGLGHGTHVAGTIAAVGNNSIGIIGVAPKAKVMAVKGLNDYGFGYTSNLAVSIIYAADMKADVINNSWGGSGSSLLITDAVDYTYAKGCVIVSAAGNGNKDVSTFMPANIPNVIAVASTGQNDVKSDFSNFGSKIAVSAPGGDSLNWSSSKSYINILSLRAKNTDLYNDALMKVGTNYYRARGTSMACPHVAGVAALLISNFPYETNEKIAYRITSSADYIDDKNSSFAERLGAGRVNAYNALVSPEKPFIKIKNSIAEETAGNGNNIVESGEEAKLVIDLENVWANANSVTAILTTTSPYISSILNSSSDFGSINTGETRNNANNPFRFKVGTIDYEKVAEFTLQVDADGFQKSYIIKVNLGTKIITDMVSNSDVKISGDNIVYIYNGRIYLYHVNTGKAECITSGPLVQAVDICGNKIVWCTYLDEGVDIYLYDLNTKIESHIVTPGGKRYLNPAVFGNNIVGEVWPGGIFGNQAKIDIYVYNLEAKAEKQLTNYPGQETNPSIYGKNVVWCDKRNGNVDIYLYNLETGIERQITTNTHDQFSPTIYENRIAWHDSRNGNADIYLFDLDKNTETRITTNTSAQCFPFINGNNIVWYDYRNINTDIYLYDINTKKETRITENTENQYFPSISNNRIIWIDWTSDPVKVCMLEIPVSGSDINQPPVVNLTANPQSGYAPLSVTLTANASDSDGYIMRYDWDLEGEGVYETSTFGSMFVIMNVYNKSGIYNPKVRVTDNKGKTAEDITQITILYSNKPPTANAGLDKKVMAGTPVEFDGSGSSDVDGSIINYSWDFGDGSTGNGKSLSHIYLNSGTYTVTLTVTDNNGAKNSDIAIVQVTQPLNKPPAVTLFPSQVTGTEPLFVTFLTSAIDSDGKIVSYEWDFDGDGNYDTVDGSRVSYTYSAGTFNPKVRVTDNGGATAEASTTIKVLPYPDLTVLDIYSDNKKLSIKIGNIGKAEVPYGRGYLYVWVDGKLTYTYGLWTIIDQAFRMPGGITVVQTWTLTGQHKIKVTIDQSNQIKETNEENNTMEKVISF